MPRRFRGARGGGALAPRVRLFAWAISGLLASAASLNAQTTVVRPTEIDDVLVNPGMGIETFQRFNGQSLNEGVQLVGSGPERRRRRCVGARHVDFPRRASRYRALVLVADRAAAWKLPAGRSSTTALSEAHATGSGWPSGSCRYDDKHAMPDWYIASGAKRANAQTDKDGAIWSPDADDPLYVSATGARWSPRRASATTAIRTSTTWTSRRWATGARDGVRICRRGRSSSS